MTYDEYRDLVKIKMEMADMLDKFSHYLNRKYYLGLEAQESSPRKEEDDGRNTNFCKRKS